jgi:N-carbamoylputrescine amidase
LESKIKIGLIQSACVADKQANIGKAVANIRKAASLGAQVVCLQELFSSLYFCDVEDHDHFGLAEPVPGPTTTLFQSLAKELNVVIIASLFEKRAEGLYHNTTAVIDADGEYMGIYRKQHIPDDPGFYEKFYFTPGDEGYKVFNTKYGRLGVLICWDQWYPEAARITSLMGAEVLLYPTAIGWAKTQPKDVNTEQFNAWQTIQRSHAIANGVFVVSVNRTGTENNVDFWGGSFVSNPLGTILYQAPHDKEEIHVQEIDLSLVNYYRIHWPFLRDRRIDTYSPIEKRFLE